VPPTANYTNHARPVTSTTCRMSAPMPCVPRSEFLCVGGLNAVLNIRRDGNWAFQSWNLAGKAATGDYLNEGAVHPAPARAALSGTRVPIAVPFHRRPNRSANRAARTGAWDAHRRTCAAAEAFARRRTIRRTRLHWAPASRRRWSGVTRRQGRVRARNATRSSHRRARCSGRFSTGWATPPARFERTTRC
jgi:hypothetical protein